MAKRKQSMTDPDDDREEQAEMIAAIEQMEPQTELAAELFSLRLLMLRAGQDLRTLDDINQELGRDEYLV